MIAWYTDMIQLKWSPNKILSLEIWKKKAQIQYLHVKIVHGQKSFNF